MPKSMLQDMVKKQKQETSKKVEKFFEYQEKKPDILEKKKIKKPKYRIYFMALVSVAILLFALSFLFSGATITVTPKTEDVPITNENLSASKDLNAPGLSFDLVVISGDESKNIQGGEMKDVYTTATGNIMIYNAYNSSSQTLSADTRLEGSNGKIYKTSKKVTVPGMSKSGKPGSVKVGIYAAGAGDSYNSDPLDFKIAGFKGTPKYSKFYGRSEGNISGGYKGKQPSISLLDKTTAISELKNTLEDKLSKKVSDQIPSGFVLFKDAVFTNIDDGNATFTPNSDSTVTADVKGTLYGFLFDQKKLAKKLAQDLIDGYNGEDIYVQNIKDLVFSMPDRASVSFADAKSINFTLSGTPKFVYKVDSAKLIADVLSRSKSEFNQVLSQYPSISSAEVKIRPFWKSSFPDKSESIEVIVNYPN